MMKPQEMQELDADMAKIMGWELCYRTADYMWAPGHIQPLKAQWWINKDGLIQFRQEDWHPTTNIAQAFEVMEKFNCDWSIHKCVHKKHPPYICLVIEGSKKMRAFKEWMSDWQLTKELAICLAAKKAWKAK